MESTKYHYKTVREISDYYIMFFMIEANLDTKEKIKSLDEDDILDENIKDKYIHLKILYKKFYHNSVYFLKVRMIALISVIKEYSHDFTNIKKDKMYKHLTNNLFNIAEGVK